MKRIFSDTRFDYTACEDYLKKLETGYENVKTAVLGKSVSGRRIYALVIGGGNRRILFTGGINGQQSDTAFILLRFADELSAAQKNGEKFCGYDADRLLSDCTLVIVPLVNPDGAEFSLYPEKAISVNSEVRFFSRRGANAHGVDLYSDFDVRLPLKAQKNESGFISQNPESEPETAALANLCRIAGFEKIMDFGLGGNGIAVEKNSGASAFDCLTAYLLSAVSGFEYTQNENGSFNGFCAWAQKEMHTCALSVQVKNVQPDEGDSDGANENLRRLLTYALVL